MLWNFFKSTNCANHSLTFLELAVLSSLENLNSILIKNGLSKRDRFKILNETSKEQLENLNKVDLLKAIKKENSSIYVDAIQKGKKETTFGNLLGAVSRAGKPDKD